MSWRGRPGQWSVYWQTLALLLLSLAVAQAVGMAMLFVLPAPRPDFNRLSDVAAALSGTQPVREEWQQREKALRTKVLPAAPEVPSGLVSETSLTHMLATRLNVGDTNVRLYFQPDMSTVPWGRRRQNRVPMRLKEPFFFGRLVAAYQTPGGWRVAATPPPPLISEWQRRILIWFAAGAVALVPLAWSFARALSRQIRRFADAADRLGTDPNAPPVLEEGAAELRVAARALNRMQQRIADYLSERTAMVGAIAHDLRTPLARIAFRIEAAPEPMREKVLADVDQMQAMISATMQFMRSASTPIERTTVDFAQLITAIVEQDRDLGRPVTRGSVAPALVNGDPLALERLVQNLIGNGISYGGAVEVSLERAGNEAQLRVADRGPGLAAEMLERVFQPFARGDPSRNRETGGIGLGLTIARSVAEDHGGRLTLANRAGGGLEALLRLPLAAV
jgi:signal transduction histidine kinase